MKKLFITLIFLVFLMSCSKNGRTIIVNTQNADGLTTESKLDVNGLEIGEVVQLNLVKDGTVNLVCNITNDIEIPINSKFKTKSTSLLGGKGIKIELGSGNGNIESGATVKMSIENSENNSNPFTKKINGIIEKLSGKEQTDSLLYELRRLNENLEDLKTRAEK
ncbi:MlaD family protein [uncultured Maribacter sp.]|uniref:MlaD family protein n=1 Tax=uncultured Maribacter sp. TaxID=431308 RepID=UPI00262E21A6|nr:MlaD family protein [uncultured Maribacter sp.]